MSTKAQNGIDESAKLVSTEVDGEGEQRFGIALFIPLYCGFSAAEGASTIEELMRRKVHFHRPGENYKTDGYVITPKTMDLLKQHLQITGGKVSATSLTSRSGSQSIAPSGDHSISARTKRNSAYWPCESY